MSAKITLNRRRRLRTRRAWRKLRDRIRRLKRMAI